MKYTYSVFPVSGLLFLGLALVALSSCEKETYFIYKPDPVVPHDDSKYARAADYFPMGLGNVWYYSVFSISSIDTLYDFALEARTDTAKYSNKTRYFRMPNEENMGWMGWGVSRSSAIDAGSGVLFHTRLMDSASSYEEVMQKWAKHDQVQWGGLHPVYTPLGVFQCIRNDHRYYDTDTFYQVRYFAKHLGLIKEEKYHLVNGNIEPEQIQLLDSTSF